MLAYVQFTHVHGILLEKEYNFGISDSFSPIQPIDCCLPPGFYSLQTFLEQHNYMILKVYVSTFLYFSIEIVVRFDSSFSLFRESKLIERSAKLLRNREKGEVTRIAVETNKLEERIAEVQKTIVSFQESCYCNEHNNYYIVESNLIGVY